MSLTPQDFRRAWSKFPTGVSLITTRTPEGGPYCTTANAISSVSLDPLLVHLSLAKTGVTCANVAREKRFGLNILGEDHEELALFFSRATSEERQRVPEQHTVTERGTWLLDEALTVMDCHVVQEIEAGDHIVFIAAVDEIVVREGKPLVFYEGRFTRVGEMP